MMQTKRPISQLVFFLNQGDTKDRRNLRETTKEYIFCKVSVSLHDP